MAKVYLCLDKDKAGRDGTLKAIEKLSRLRVRGEGSVIVVEGQMDCIKLHQAGFENTVALGGSNMTDSMAQQIGALFGHQDDDISCSIDEALFFNGLEKEWREKEDSRNIIKELLETSPKLASYVNVVADEKTQKKVRIYVKQKKDPFFIPFDVREKMQGYPLKEYMEAVWPIKFRLNACQCHLPGHKDRTASCHVYPNTNSFYCFGCHRGGSLVDFLMHNDKMEIKQAIDYIKHL